MKAKTNTKSIVVKSYECHRCGKSGSIKHSATEGNHRVMQIVRERHGFHSPSCHGNESDFAVFSEED